MTKLALCVALISIIGIAGFLPFSGTDVAKLHPVEVLIVDSTNEGIMIRTDTGLYGVGENVDSAIEDLKRSASGEIFMETANYILLRKESEHFLSEFYMHLRPACQVYILEGEGELKNVAKYLEVHPSKATVLSYRQGETNASRLVIQNGVFDIVES